MNREEAENIKARFIKTENILKQLNNVLKANGLKDVRIHSLSLKKQSHSGNCPQGCRPVCVKVGDKIICKCVCT